MAEFARTFVLSMGGGSTREIASPEEAAAEIAAGALRRDTLVVAYEGGRGRSLRAGDAPELRPLFDAGLGAGAPRSESTASAEVVAPLAPSESGAPAASVPPPSAAKPAPAPAVPLTPAGRRRGLGCGPTLLIWVLAMAAAVWLLSQCVQRAGSELAYVTRPTVLRAGPSAAAPARGDLPRGAAVRGATDRRDKAWFKVNAGRGSGSWLWRRNLSTRRRPGLTGDPAPRRAPAATVLRAEADSDAPAVGRVIRGEALTPAGVTRDGWVELRLPGGGVGYLRR